MTPLRLPGSIVAVGLVASATRASKRLAPGLGLADRFLAYALFGGELLLPSAYLIDTATLAVIAFLAWRLGRARKMVSQYPWLYERDGLLSWRAKSPPAA